MKKLFVSDDEGFAVSKLEDELVRCWFSRFGNDFSDDDLIVELEGSRDGDSWEYRERCYCVLRDCYNLENFSFQWEYDGLTEYKCIRLLHVNRLDNIRFPLCDFCG